MTFTFTETESYTYTDIETVVRRLTADLLMIAQSSGAITENEAYDYAHDIETLAKFGYLKKVDITLLSGASEIRAIQYVVNTSAGGLTMSRPGAVLWPCVENPYLRIVLGPTSSYDAAAEARMKGKLRFSWAPTNADISHSYLKRGSDRSYASNGWGLQRTDYSA